MTWQRLRRKLRLGGSRFCAFPTGGKCATEPAPFLPVRGATRDLVWAPADHRGRTFLCGLVRFLFRQISGRQFPLFPLQIKANGVAPSARRYAVARRRGGERFGRYFFGCANLSWSQVHPWRDRLAIFASKKRPHAFEKRRVFFHCAACSGKVLDAEIISRRSIAYPSRIFG